MNNLAIKYRPNTLDELLIDDENRKLLQSYIDNQKIPPILLDGPPGIGKTTIAKILVQEIAPHDNIYVNASSENGIDMVRNKVENFISKACFDGGIKIVFMDEADGLSNSAQQSLKNPMEEYGEYVRFIFTTNNLSKIDDAIKSRCKKIHFNPDFSQYMKRCVTILNKEGIQYEKSELAKFFTEAKKAMPDMRTILTDILEPSIISGKLEVRPFVAEKVFIPELINVILSGSRPFDTRKFYLENSSKFNNDYYFLMVSMINNLTTYNMDVDKKCEWADMLGEFIWRHSTHPDPEINFFTLILNLK